MTQGFAKWKESTNISPLTRRLGHLKFFVVLDECDSNPDHFYINQHMLQTINTIINAAKKAGTPLRKWFSSTIVMIEKVPNTPRINKLHVVNIMKQIKIFC